MRGVFHFWLEFSLVRGPISLGFGQNILDPEFVGPNSFVLFLNRIVRLNLWINSQHCAKQNIFFFEASNEFRFSS